MAELRSESNLQHSSMPYLKFTDFTADANTAEVVMYGIPFEGSVNLRRGAAMGPGAIPEYSHFIETYSPELERDLEDMRLFDGGDLHVGERRRSIS